MRCAARRHALSLSPSAARGEERGLRVSSTAEQAQDVGLELEHVRELPIEAEPPRAGVRLAQEPQRRAQIAGLGGDLRGVVRQESARLGDLGPDLREGLDRRARLGEPSALERERVRERQPIRELVRAPARLAIERDRLAKVLQRRIGAAAHAIDPRELAQRPRPHADRVGVERPGEVGLGVVEAVRLPQRLGLGEPPPRRRSARAAAGRRAPRIRGSP